MKRWIIGACGLAALGASAFPLAAQTTPAALLAPDVESVTYTVVRGDNLYTIAQRYLSRIDDSRRIQRLNHVGNPWRVPIGTILRLPLALLRFEPLTARVTAFRGNAEMTVDAHTTPLAAGMAIPAGALLSTGDIGFVTLTLSNGSRIALPTHSVLRIRTMRRLVINKAVLFDFVVEAGKAETEVTPLPAGTGSFRLETPRAISAVRGTHFRVGFDPAHQTSTTEVIEGHVAVSAGAVPAAGPSVVDGGFGAGITPDGKIAQEALLKAPDLKDPGHVQVDPRVALNFDPVTGANAYHVQIASDAGFVDVAHETTSPTPAIILDNLANGVWFVRGTAIAASGLEGLPETYTLRRALTGIGGAAGAGAQDEMKFKWFGEGDGARRYRFQLIKDKMSNLPTVDEAGLEVNEISVKDLPPGVYYWRVGVQQFGSGDPTENWLGFEKLTVTAPDR